MTKFIVKPKPESRCKNKVKNEDIRIKSLFSSVVSSIPATSEKECRLTNVAVKTLSSLSLVLTMFNFPNYLSFGLGLKCKS